MDNNESFLLAMLIIGITVVSCTYIIFGRADDGHKNED